MQGPIVFLNVATNFEYNLIILHHSLHVNSCRSNHVCRGHLVRCNNHVQLLLFGVVWALCIAFNVGMIMSNIDPEMHVCLWD